MLMIALSILRYIVWGLASLYLIMTVRIWSATLRTLGLSSVRRCPRLLRLAFRASQLRELSVILLSAPLAIFLSGVYGRDNLYVAALPLNAFMLIAVLCFTLIFVPPTALVLSSSTDRQLRWALALRRYMGSRRVISLLDTGYMALKPSAGDAWSILMRRSGSLTDVLRTSSKGDWQQGVRELIEIAPIVIVDTRVCTQALLFEASTILDQKYVYKAIFVSKDDGASPVLERLLEEGRIRPDTPVSLVKESDLGMLLQRRTMFPESLPKPGGFAAAPVRISGKEVMSYRSPASLGDALPTVRRTEERSRLSSSLTPLWLLMARAVVWHLLISVICGAWFTVALSQHARLNLSTLSIWPLIACNFVTCGIYFYLARSLKKVSLESDTLFVWDHRKEIPIHLSQVSRITGPDWTVLRRIVIHLNKPNSFGDKVIFAGRLFSAGAIARDLRQRLYAQADTRMKPY